MRSPGLVGSFDGDLPMIYWRIINQEVRLRLGGKNTAPMMATCDNAEVLAALLRREDWDGLTNALTDLARVLPAAGADGLVICGSPLNPVAREIGRTLRLPVVSMGQAIAETLRLFRYRRVVVLGTKTGREEKMWHEELDGIGLIDPTPGEWRWLAETAEADPAENADGRRVETNRVMSALRKRGVQAVVLADPALARWVNLEESLVPVFDAAEIHAWAAAGWALSDAGCMLSAPPCVVRGD
jgi:aspartate racemase